MNPHKSPGRNRFEHLSCAGRPIDQQLIALIRVTDSDQDFAGSLSGKASLGEEVAHNAAACDHGSNPCTDAGALAVRSFEHDGDPASRLFKTVAEQPQWPASNGRDQQIQAPVSIEVCCDGRA